MATRHVSDGAASVTYDRVPPHNIEAEESVLGSMLLSKDAIAEVLELLHEEDFYRPAHRTVFRSVLELYSHGQAVDAITVAEALRRGGELADIGGAPFLHTLVSSVPTAANAGFYARIVKETGILRRLIDVGTRIVQLGYETPQDTERAVDEAEALVYRVAQGRVTEDYQSLREVLTSTLESIERLHEDHRELTGVPSGFPELDRLTSGFQGSNLIIVAARPAVGKCISADALVTEAQTGRRMTIAELVRRGRAGEDVRLHTLDDDWQLRGVRPSAFIDNGVKPVLRLTTRSGRSVRVTGNHPFRTLAGWVPLERLRPGARVAVPRRLECGPSGELPDALVARSARLLSGGSPTGHVPEDSFRLPERQLRLFLSHLYASDGWASVRETRRGTTSKRASARVEIGYRTRSERLARDVQHLLLRLGLAATVQRAKVTRTGTSQAAWQVVLRDRRQVARFCREIGIFSKEREVQAVLDAVGQRDGGAANLDTIPRAVWELIGDERGRRSWAEISRRCGRPRNHNWHAGRQDVGRERLALLAKGLDSEPLRRLADAEVVWDEVVRVEPDGVARVYDLSVEGTRNFVANDIVVHNSTLGLDIARYATVRAEVPTVVFSLEMSKTELVQRLMCAECGVDMQRLRTGRMEDSDWTRLTRSLGKLAEAPLFIDDSAALTMMELRAKSRRLKQHHGLGLVIVDYLQLMQPTKRVENRQQEVSEISRSLKLLAKELEVPVIAISQLSRQTEARSDKRPMLSDLRESGALEQDADLVLFIYRDDLYDPESPRKGEADLIVAKHRNGPTDSVTVTFQGQYSRFVPMATRGL